MFGSEPGNKWVVLRFRDTSSGKLKYKSKKDWGGVKSCKFLYDNKKFVMISTDGTHTPSTNYHIRKWNYVQKKKFFEFNDEYTFGDLPTNMQCTLASDGREFACSVGGDIHVHRINDNKELLIIPVHVYTEPLDFQLSGDGRLLAYKNNEDKIEIWKVPLTDGS